MLDQDVFVTRLQRELAGLGLSIGKWDLTRWVIENFDITSKIRTRALYTPASDVWAVQIDRDVFLREGCLQDAHSEISWSWSRVEALGYMLAITDDGRLSPTSVSITERAISFYRHSSPLVSLYPVAFLPDSPQTARCERILKGVRRYELGGKLSRFASLPGFTRIRTEEFPEAPALRGCPLSSTPASLAQGIAEVLADSGAPQPLHAVQELTARVLGFPDWQRLKHAERKNCAPCPQVIWTGDHQVVSWHRSPAEALWRLSQLAVEMEAEGSVYVDIEGTFGGGDFYAALSRRNPEQDKIYRKTHRLNVPGIPRNDYWVEHPVTTYCDEDSAYWSIAVQVLAAPLEKQQALLEASLGTRESPGIRGELLASRQKRLDAKTIAPYRISLKKQPTRGNAIYLYVERLTAEGTYDLSTPPLSDPLADEYFNHWPVFIPRDECVLKTTQSGVLIFAAPGIDGRMEVRVELPDLSARQIVELAEFLGLPLTSSQT